MLWTKQVKTSLLKRYPTSPTKTEHNLGLQMEDPSSALSRFVAELKALGYDSYSSAWDAAAPGQANPLKLRAGYGDAVARALLFLTEKAMEARGWRWQRAALGAGEV